jgi:hypothetical protein
VEDRADYSGWQRVYEGGGSDVVVELLANHGVEAEILRVPAPRSRGWNEAVWVQDADYNRALELIQKMRREMENPPAGFPWRCSACKEEIEPQFDICWSCGRERSANER